MRRSSVRFRWRCEVAKDGFEATGRKNRLFHEFEYAAGSWSRSRRVIARIEHGPKGRNPRFIVTNLDGEANELYARVYFARGDMENRIKEQQLALFADRTSSTKWWINQYRVLLAALAYTPCSRRYAAPRFAGRTWLGRNARPFGYGY